MYASSGGGMNNAAKLGGLVLNHYPHQHSRAAGRKLRNLGLHSRDTVAFRFERIDQRTESRSENLDRHGCVCERVLFAAGAVGDQHAQCISVTRVKLIVVEQCDNETVRQDFFNQFLRLRLFVNNLP